MKDFTEYPEYTYDRQVRDLEDIIKTLEAKIDKQEKQLALYGVVKSLPVDRETALKVREDIINEHYKDDPNKSTFGLAFITCYDWLAKLCTK